MPSILAKYYDRPIFIISAGRSGSTALKLALAAHSQIMTRSGEAPMISFFSQLVYYLDHDPYSKYYRRDLRVSPDVLRGKLKRICIEITFGSHFGFYYLLKTSFRKPLLTKRMHWCAKTSPSETEYQGLLNLFPKAKFIFLVRNGLDQIVSMAKSLPGRSFREFCTNWGDQINRYAYAFNSERFLTVRHEDLVQASDESLAKVFDFCQLEHEEKPAQLLKSKKINTTKKTADTSIVSYLDNKKPEYMNWSEEQKTIFKEICGDLMHKLNYSIPF